MANKDKDDQQKRPRNADQEWVNHLNQEREPMPGRNVDPEEQPYRSHLPAPFYNAKEENYHRVQYPAEAPFPNQLNEDLGNYGRGGYYGSTYDQETYSRERNRSREPGSAQQDNYRNLGDKRWDDGRGGWWEVERSTRHGYTPEQQRMERAGIHKGKGPRSYHRSDERIKEDINDRLYDDPFLDATDIEVEVRDGEIILKGTVEDRLSKRRAEDICETVSGVKNIENRLRIMEMARGIKDSTGRSNISESLL